MNKVKFLCWCLLTICIALCVKCLALHPLPILVSMSSLWIKNITLLSFTLQMFPPVWHLSWQILTQSQDLASPHCFAVICFKILSESKSKQGTIITVTSSLCIYNSRIQSVYNIFNESSLVSYQKGTTPISVS